MQEVIGGNDGSGRDGGCSKDNGGGGDNPCKVKRCLDVEDGGESWSLVTRVGLRLTYGGQRWGWFLGGGVGSGG